MAKTGHVPRTTHPKRGGGSVQNSLPYNIVGRRTKPVPSDSRRWITQERRCDEVSSRDALALPSLMTVEELAELLRTSRGAVYARHARGGIPGALRLGRTLRFDRTIIVHWLSANSTSAGDRS